MFKTKVLHVANSGKLPITHLGGQIFIKITNILKKDKQKII